MPGALRGGEGHPLPEHEAADRLAERHAVRQIEPDRRRGELPLVGDEVSEEGEFGSVESVKAASDLISPVSGDVTGVNTALEDAPEKCNSDPYGEGWLMKVNVSRKPEGLMDAAAYEAFCATEGH